MKERKLVTCPKCGYRFSIYYSRTLYCLSCPYSIYGSCDLVKCPRCGYEFPPEEGLTLPSKGFRNEY